MGTFRVTSSQLNNNFEYKDSANTMIIIGNYQKDVANGTLQSINGSCYRQNQNEEQGEYFGNFNGYMRDNEVKYSMSEMSRLDANAVWDAIDEIEPLILGEDNPEE